MILDRIKEAGDIIFEDMGITYLGPVDGHDIKAKEGVNMKRTINRVLSLTLAGVLAFTSSDLSAFAAQPDVIAEEGASDEDDILATEAELKEKLAGAADETQYPGGVFGFYETILNAAEGDETVISVVRQGSTDKEASVLFKAVDVSTEYQKDYTLSVENSGIFGEKELPAAKGVRPLLEEYGEAATEEDLQTQIQTESSEEGADKTDSGQADSNKTDSNKTSSDKTDAPDKAIKDSNITEDSTNIGGNSSLANIYSAQTGEEAPEYDWTEYTEEKAPEETIEVMQSGWDESRENLESLPGVTVRLTFAPGEYKKDIKVRVKDDARSESDEVMVYVLQDAEGAEVGDCYNGYLNISDNDGHEDLTYSIKEKNLTVTPDQDIAVVTVVRHSGIDQMDFVTVGTQAIDAQPDVDYEKTCKELFFAAGVTERTVEVPIISDRDYETHFWIGVRSTGGTVLEDNACCVTIAERDESSDILKSDSYEISGEESENITWVEVDSDTVEALNAGSGTTWEDNIYNGHAEFSGNEGWKVVKSSIDLRSADYVKVEYGVFGYEKNEWLGVVWSIDRKRKAAISLNTRDGSYIKPEIWHEAEADSDHFNETNKFTDYFRRDDNEVWNISNAILWARAQGVDIDDSSARVSVYKVWLGYSEYNFSIDNSGSEYREQVYTALDAANKGSLKGNIVKYPKVYFTDGNGDPLENKLYRSGDKLTVSKAARGETPTTQGVYASDETVKFKGFRLRKPNDLSHPLSDDILPAGFTIDNAFKIKYKDYLYKSDNTYVLVPVFVPKTVTVTFDNSEASVSGKADVKGMFDGFKSDSVLTCTMLDTIDVKAKANQNYGITGMQLRRPRAVKYSGGAKKNTYVAVTDNQKQSSVNEFVTPVNFSGVAYNSDYTRALYSSDLKLTAYYDVASITIAPDPQSDKSKMKDQGDILYVGHTVEAGEKKVGITKHGGETIKLGGDTEKISIGKPYTFGSITRENSGYHTIWMDGTLDYDGDGVYNDTHPSYKPFRNSIGQSIEYVTKLPISKIYYTFVKTINSDFKPVPIRGWLILDDKLLISGDESNRGLNGIRVFCDDQETETGYGTFDGKAGNGYFELSSPDYYKIYNYALTFTGTCYAGDIAAMTHMNPGRNEEIHIKAWEDVNVSDVNLYQKEKVKDKTGKEVEQYSAIDTSSAKEGYYTGLTDGDYEYRIQMTAHRDGVNITKAELTFYDKAGNNGQVIEGKEDNNHSGIFTFDFNPKKLSIKAGATARVTFYAGDTRFLTRDVGIKLRASLGVVNVANALTGGDPDSARVDIIGAVNSLIEMGWQGSFDKVTVTGDIYTDEDQNKVVKVGISKNIVDTKSKDAMMEKAEKAASQAKTVGKTTSEIAKLENKISKADESEKEALQKELKDKQDKLAEQKGLATRYQNEFDEALEDAKKPQKSKPKFGNSFKMDLGFSFLMTFGYDDDADSWYFKNIMLTASVQANYKVTMTYATPVGVTIGIGLTLGLNGSASFVIEQRKEYANDPSKRYYINESNKDNISVLELDYDGDSSSSRFANYGLFSINPYIKLDVSAGIGGGMLSVEVSGKANFNMVFGTKSDSAGSCTLSAKISITALVFTFSKEIANKTYQLWGDEEILNNGTIESVCENTVMNALGDTDDSYLYESIDAFAVQDVSYMNGGLSWYGGEGMFDEDNSAPAVGPDGSEIEDLGAIDEGGQNAYRESPLADKIGRNADFDMISLGNGRYAAVFLNVPEDRINDPENSEAAYYTLYDKGSWSVPELLENDGTLDMYPRIYSLKDKGAFIVWSSVNENYKDTKDKIIRQNAFDLHGRFVDPDGSLKDGIEEITRTTIDEEGKQIGSDFSDFASDKAFGLFMNADKMVVCYEKRQYSSGGNKPEVESDEGAKVGDMLYPVSSMMAARSYDFSSGKFNEGMETLSTLPGLKALGDSASDRVEAYNDNVYGQVFYPYLPDVMLHEDIEHDAMKENFGYYREGISDPTAVFLEHPDSAMLLDSDAAAFTGNGTDLGVLAYTLDTDGNLHTLNDRELYLITYDMSEDRFGAPIIMTGQEINSDTGESYTPEISNPRFIDTDNGLYLSWLKNPDIVAVNVSKLLMCEDKVVKTGVLEEIQYRYIDKSYASGDAGAPVYYKPPVPIVTGRIAEETEGSEQDLTGNIHSFDVSTDGHFIYFVWPEAAQNDNSEESGELTDTQMWCARTEAVGSESTQNLEGTTRPVQITSHLGNHYDDVAFEVTSDGRMIGLTRKVPSRLITMDEAAVIHGNDFDRDAFVPYPIWDDAAAYPVSFWVDPASVTRIKNAGFIDANVSEGAPFSFEILNDGFDTLTGATVTAVDADGNSLLYDYQEDQDGESEKISVPSLTVPDLTGGDRAAFAGFLELDKDAKKAEVIITVTDSKGHTARTSITQELSPDVEVYDMSVEATGGRGIYRVTGTVKNSGTAKADTGYMTFAARKSETDRTLTRVLIPELMPGEIYDIDEFITASDEDFTVSYTKVDMTSGKVIEENKTEGLSESDIGDMVTEELQLYAKYFNGAEDAEIPVYEFDNDYSWEVSGSGDDAGSEATDDAESSTKKFIKRVAYPSEMETIKAVTGVTVSAVAAMEGENGETIGNIVSKGTGLITLEAGESVGLITDINSTLSGEVNAVDDSGHVYSFTTTGAEGLTYAYEFTGDVAELDDEERLTALKTGSGKLKVYVYPADRSYSTTNYVRTEEESELGAGFDFEMLTNGDTDDTFSEYPAEAIRTYVLDVDVVGKGERISDITKAYFTDANGIKYRIAGKSEVAVCGIDEGKSVTQLKIPATVKNEGVSYKVTRIDVNAFSGNDRITKATIGKNVTIINSRAFAGCTALKKVTFAKSVETICEGAFEGCMALTGLSLPSKLVTIENSAFEGCINITQAVLPATLMKLGNRAFYGCENLKNITVKSDNLSAENTGRDVFTGVSQSAEYKFNMKNAAAKEALGALITDDTETFANKKGIIFKVRSYDAKTVTVAGLTDAARGKLKSLKLPASVSYKGNKYSVAGIEDSAFEGNTKLKKVTIPKTVISIGDRAFAGMISLKSAVLPVTVKKLGDEAYKGDTALTKVTISSADISIGSDAFEDVPDTAVFNIKVKDVAAKKRITNRIIGDVITFADKKGLRYEIYNLDNEEVILISSPGVVIRTLSVPATISYRGVKFPVTGVDYIAFKDDTNLKSIKLGKNVKGIEAGAFEGCTSLTKVTMKSIISIGDDAFRDCTSLKTVTVGKDLALIGEYAFEGCTNLKKVPIASK